MIRCLSRNEIDARLLELNSITKVNWNFEEKFIKNKFIFEDFNQAFSFMGKVAALSEESFHHPDWSNVYNVVDIRLMTHSVNGISELDFNLASAIEKCTV